VFILRLPLYKGRNELETLLASPDSRSEMIKEIWEEKNSKCNVKKMQEE
jgi:hypothetical protein